MTVKREDSSFETLHAFAAVPNFNLGIPKGSGERTGIVDFGSRQDSENLMNSMVGGFIILKKVDFNFGIWRADS